MRVRAYIFCSRLLDSFLAFVHASFVGFWLGMLRPADLRDLDTHYYRRQSMYREDAYNHRGLFPWERDALQRYFGACRRLAVTAAGGGREVLALARMGYQVDAFECNPALAEYANAMLAEAGYPAAVAACERDICPRIAGRPDGVIVGWGSFTLIPGRERRIRFLRDLRRAIHPGAPVLLSFFAVDRLRGRMIFARKLGNILRRVRAEEPIEDGDDLSPNYVHRFTRAEVAETLSAAGFQMAWFDSSDYGLAVGVAAGIGEECRAGVTHT
jgi:hypothetical protein